MAPTWSKSPRASLSADLTPAESSPAPLWAGPGSEKKQELVKKKGAYVYWLQTKNED